MFFFRPTSHNLALQHFCKVPSKDIIGSNPLVGSIFYISFFQVFE